MLAERAQEIVASDRKVGVLHNDIPVWIEEIYNDRARIRYLDTGRDVEVPIHDLTEMLQ
ncbi:MAG: small, acid-soluble spore protein, H family [Solirubrobacterales bacterium]